MRVDEHIRHIGFRRWYERRLIEAHAYLITCLLGIVLIFAGMEMALSAASWLMRGIGVGVGISGAALAGFGLTQYAKIFGLAERLSARASCPQCEAFGAFNILSSRPGSSSADPNSQTMTTPWLRVQCRSCGATWVL